MEFKNGIVEMITEPISTNELFNGDETIIISIKENGGSKLYAIPRSIFMVEKPDVREQVFFILNNEEYVDIQFNANTMSKVYTGISSISPYRER